MKKKQTTKYKLTQIEQLVNEELAVEVLDSLNDLIREISARELVIAMPHINRIFDAMEERGISIPPALRRMIRSYASASVEVQHKILREYRIAERQAKRKEYVEKKPTLCYRCNKRPVKFDNYCGRCAEELGIRPKGKIV